MSPASRWRGGAIFAAVGSPRARAVVMMAGLGAGALAAGLGLVATPADLRLRVVVAGTLGLALLAAAARWPGFLAPGLLGVAASALAPLARTSGERWGAVASAALLVATAELVGWAADLRSVTPVEPAVLVRRALRTVVLALGAGALAAALLVIARLEPPGGALPVVLGGGAVVALMAFAALRQWPADAEDQTS